MGRALLVVEQPEGWYGVHGVLLSMDLRAPAVEAAWLTPLSQVPVKTSPGSLQVEMEFHKGHLQQGDEALDDLLVELVRGLGGSS